MNEIKAARKLQAYMAKEISYKKDRQIVLRVLRVDRQMLRVNRRVLRVNKRVLRVGEEYCG